MLLVCRHHNCRCLGPCLKHYFRAKHGSSHQTMAISFGLHLSGTRDHPRIPESLGPCAKLDRLRAELEEARCEAAEEKAPSRDEAILCVCVCV